MKLYLNYRDGDYVIIETKEFVVQREAIGYKDSEGNFINLNKELLETAYVDDVCYYESKE